MDSDKQKHLVAIFGGAVSGAEAAHQLSKSGVEVIVFDQHLLPYGKLEDGLPKWHAKLRDKEEAKIDERLHHPLVHFVPGVRLGRDLDLNEMATQWGLSSILLAIGAWRDRPLPIAGISSYIHKGLLYQNELIYWYNHKHEPDYQGPTCQLEDNAIIVGGGLASLDVAKVLMFETVEKALRERGHEVSLFTLDRSIAKVLDRMGYTLEDLGIKGCTLYYRRRIKDMPLSPKPAQTPDEVRRVHQIQEKIFHNYQSKYLFKVKPCHMPVDKIVEEGVLTGLVFQRTKIEEGRVVSIPKSTYPVRSPLTISSIGSIPEVINGIPMQGQVFRICQEECCRIEGFQNVFALGNAVTGRGNIRESQRHGRQVAEDLNTRYLDEETKYQESFRSTEQAVEQHLDQINLQLDRFDPPTKTQRSFIYDRIRSLQKKIGYDGNYPQWILRHRPPRLETLLDES